MDSDLRTTVLRLNPWIESPDRLEEVRAEHVPDPYVARDAAQRLRRVLRSARRAHLVIGPRQAGKSTLVWSALEAVDHLLYLNCEEPQIRRWCTSPVNFVAEAREFLPRGGFLFLEEAQWLDEAGLFVKGVIDQKPGWIIVVTGSASFHLLARTRESLAGRATRHRVWPLTLVEASADRAGGIPAARRAARDRALERMLIWGSYPGVWTSNDPRDELTELVEAFVMRDASDRFRIERPDAFRLVLRLAAGQIGDLVRYAEWAPIAGISAPTVTEYIGILCETHIVVTARPFIGGRRAELTQAPKLYFIDNGLRNAVSGGFEPLDRRPDVGRLMENWVFSELHKRYPKPGDIRYWRTKSGAEVDFVLEPEPGRVIGIEAKARSGSRPKLSRGARSFINAYAPSEFLLVYRGEEHEERIEGTRVRWVPAALLPEAMP